MLARARGKKINTGKYRCWDHASAMKDELDGVELRLSASADSIEIAKVVTSALSNTHKNVQDLSVTIPAAVLAQQQRTETISHT